MPFPLRNQYYPAKIHAPAADGHASTGKRKDGTRLMKGKNIRKLIALTIAAALFVTQGSGLSEVFADDLTVSANDAAAVSSSAVSAVSSAEICSEAASTEAVSDTYTEPAAETLSASGSTAGVITANGTTVTGSNTAYSSAMAGQNTAYAQNSGTLCLTGDTLTKSGDSTDADSCNFYGTNSISLTSGAGSTTYISDSSLSASSSGSNGIFAYNSGAVYANNDTISTTAANSRGLDATYSGKIIANRLDIDTASEHCGGLATDREGGYISVTNSQIDTQGNGSPVIYSTGTIETDNVTGKASGAQAVGMEGLNNVRIYNSTIEGSDAKASEPYYNGIMLYQSMSGDSKSGTADFEVYNSTIRSSIDDGTSSAAMFYVTNTTANVVLKDTLLDFNPNKALLIAALGNNCNSWGTAGSNGGLLTFTAIGETLKGNILTDTISYVNLYLTAGTSYSGKTMINTNSVNAKTTAAPVTMNIDSTSEWIVTGNSTVTSLNTAAGAKIVDLSGNTVTVRQGSSTMVSGTSPYTVTVTGTYTAGASVSGKSLSDPAVSRTAFDSYYNTATSFNSNGSAKSTNLLYDEAISGDSSDDSGSSGNNSGTDTTPVNSRTAISKAAVSGLTSATYTGSAITEAPVLTYKGTKLVEGTDYTVTYMNNTNVGRAALIFTGTGSYKGTMRKYFRIKAAAFSSGNTVISASDDSAEISAVYLKGGTKPAVLVKFNGTALTQGTDYTVRYTYNRKVAAASDAKAPTVRITGRGNYSGTLSKTFTITASSLSALNAVADDVVYRDKAGNFKNKMTITDSDGKVLTAGTDYARTFSYAAGGSALQLTQTAASGSTVTITATGLGAYAGSTVSASYRLTAKKNFSAATVTAVKKYYTGSAVRLSQADLTVRVHGTALNLVTGSDSDGYEIVSGSYVNNVNVGTATVILRGCGSYSGIRKVKFRIYPAVQ